LFVPKDVSSKFIHKMLIIVLIYHIGFNAFVGLFVAPNCIIVNVGVYATLGI